MVVCERCNKEKKDNDSCTEYFIEYEGGIYTNPFLFGELDPDSRFERCPDCGIKQGGYHHKYCDWERCPFCGEHIISCSCTFH